MPGWPILSTITFLPLVGALFILVIRGDDAVAVRNMRWNVGDRTGKLTGAQKEQFTTIADSMMAKLTAAEEERARISLKTVLEPVAEALGNTPAISRKSYVHPRLIDAARDRPRNPLNGMERPRARKWLSSAEVGLLDFLAGKKRRPNAASVAATEAATA